MKRRGEVIFSSEAERQRRYSALRSEMEAAGLEAMVVYGRGDERVRGRVFYVTDIWQAHGEAFLVLPLVGDPVFVNDRLAGLDQAVMSTWVRDLRSEEHPGLGVGDALRGVGLERGTIGIVGLSDRLPVPYFEQITSTLPSAVLRDATASFERVRQLKSSEELSNLQETSILLRECFTALEQQLRPGVTERGLMAEAARLTRAAGCLETLVYLATSPFEALSWGTERVLEAGDCVVIWLECAGPSGYWLELNRCFSIGPRSSEAARVWDIQLRVFGTTVDALRPGLNAEAIVDVAEEIYEASGYSLGDVYLMHGIGTDSNEGMWVPGNDRELAEGEVVSVHPYIQIEDPIEAAAAKYIVLTDNVLVTKSGGEPLTYSAPEWTEV